MHARVLIGMDIINLGDFAVTNKNGRTAFSFRTPSIEYIDFGHPKQKQPPPLQSPPPAAATSKVGRNDPCPCGSGEKFKKCHGK